MRDKNNFHSFVRKRSRICQNTKDTDFVAVARVQCVHIMNACEHSAIL